MLISGILSIIQVLFLPGFLLLFFLNMHKGIIRCILLSCALSLVINFYLVCLLTLLHVYNPFSVYMIVIIELAVLFLFRNLHHQKYEWFPASEYHYPSDAGLLRNITIVHIVVLFFVIQTVMHFIGLFYASSTHALIYRDAALSFNRWAVSWYHGLLPAKTWDYPQLLSANWSLTYQFIINDVVQLFASSLTALFSLFIFAVLLDLGVRTKRLAYFIAVIIVGYLFLHSNGSFQDANWLVTFFTLISFYLLILASLKTNASEIKRLIYLGAITSAGAALTKQSGLFIAFLYPAFVYLFVLKNKKVFRKMSFGILICYLVIVALILPWYLYNWIQIFLGYEHSAFSSLLSHQLNNDFSQRILFAFRSVYTPNYGKIFGWIIIPVALFFGMITSKVYRQILLIFILPYFVIWVLFFGYDPRNLDVIIPLVAITMGYGIDFLIVSVAEFARRKFHLERAWAYILIIGLGLIFIVCYYNQKYDATYLFKQQTSQQMKMSDPVFNKVLYGHFYAVRDRDRVLTNLLYADLLPGIKQMFVYNDLVHLNVYYKKLNEVNPQYLVIDKFMIVQRQAVQQNKNEAALGGVQSIRKFQVDQFIYSKLLAKLNGYYKIVFNAERYMIVRLDHKRLRHKKIKAT